MTPARGRVFVGPIAPAETLLGGRIVLPASARETLAANQAEVLAVGADGWCEDFENCSRPPECHGSVSNVYGVGRAAATHVVDLQIGDWVVLRPRCLQDTDVPTVQCCHQDDVLAILSAE